MLSSEKLNKLLAAGYNRSQWLKALEDLFGADNINEIKNPKTIRTGKAKKLELKQIGEIVKMRVGNSGDGKLALFETQITSKTQLRLNRSELRNLVANNMRDYQGALAVYHNPTKSNSGKAEWRFSFISKEQRIMADGTIINDDTDPKRFTYLLGEGAQIRTAVIRFTELANTFSAEGVSLEAIKAAFAVETLNKEFYEKLFIWYSTAQKQTEFPNDEKTNHHEKIALIRLLTRLLFVWFIKEKGLVSADFFDKTKVKELINWKKPSSYYKAILQNLFFATLNKGIAERRFRDPIKKNAINNKNYMVTNIYRYENYFNKKDREYIIALFAKTPFLNGGLFECLDREASPAEQTEYDKNKKLRNERETIRVDGFSDRDDNKIKLPNELFFNDNGNTGLIDILSQYQFTLEENTALDNDIALDPELLGKVFENLLASYNPETKQSARDALGTFYTPREIVAYMVDESLKAYLSQTLTATQEDIAQNPKPPLIKPEKEQGALAVPACTPEEAEEGLNALFIAHDKDKFNDEQINLLIKAIDKIKILDPAVGSGAFAMGVLNRLVELLAILDFENEQWKEQQLENLTDPESIAAVEEVFSAENQHNNYGRKLYLIEKAIFGVDIQPIAIQICKLRFFISLVIEQTSEENADKNHHIKPLPNLEIKFVAADSLIRLNKPTKKDDLRSLTNFKAEKIKKELEKTRSKMFATKIYATKKKLREKDEELRSQLAKELERAGWEEGAAKLIANWDPYNQSASADWFDANYMFGVLNNFNIVIGNPPYVQLQKEGGRLADCYQGQKYETFARMGDIYQLFYERGHGLLNNTGHLCYITSNQWMRTGYGGLTRNYFASHTQPQKLMDLGPDIFESATVDTNILLLSKQPQGNRFLACTVKKSDKKTPVDLWEQNWLSLPIPSGDSPWIILSAQQQGLKEKMEAIGTPLREWDIKLFRGITTGCNGAFIIDTETKERLCREDTSSTELIKPVLRGRDIKRYHHKWAGFWLINSHNGDKERKRIDINDYPAVKRHLDKFYDRLEPRQDQGYTPYNLRSCAYLSRFEREKIIQPQTAKIQSFTFDDNRYFHDVTAQFFVSETVNLKYILGMLNSRMVNFFVRKTAYAYGEQGTRWIPLFLEQIPVPKATKKEQRPIIELVDKILAIKKKDATTDTSGYESEIDHLVYSLYDLTPAEITTIETPS